ncbi:MAG: ABC transporter ATP-binding protein [Lachnospiraceae bacterium]|nr:ABC transporter ATP-binding protein [Lachnospiraceae bacterium]MCM1240170.1 ABC transporter ATP-binding protein [Lachnospiraceae bacterium]MCM1304079.1 ABC transporter ATP-binding protein [Butyrivibrio sp.]MCM1343591.1 ABC transporter ATP-binding protein [Muribaculaceae bacterium]MCM1411240.1 ABC transporter ATP-binding protein [Lachnospiraceae bacterium]
MNALEITELSKSFPGFRLEHINLTLPSGCIMGLIGENGAGKSTTIKLILNMLHKDSGSITVLGRNNEKDIRLIKEEVGVVMDETGIPQCLTPKQVERIMRHTFRNWNYREYTRLLDKFSIPPYRPFHEFSRGTKMKLGIAIAMSHGSRLLLLDEATNGLDPLVRDEVLEMFSEFTRDENHSILLSSHIVSDLEKICDYVAFLHKGKLLLCEEKDLLLAQYGIIHCTAEQLRELNPAAVRYQKKTPYGVEAMVMRNAVPSYIEVSPINMEELFIYMAREEKPI